MVQLGRGLRPSEMLSLTKGDVIFPEESISFGQRGIIINLGTKKGTKAKRPQAVIAPNESLEALLLRRVAQCLQNDDDRFFPFTIKQYNALLKRAEDRLQISVGYTPHSPRAGFASQARAGGMDFVELREQGRWLSDSSLRVYLDVLGAASLECEMKLKGLHEHMSRAVAVIKQVLSAEALAVGLGAKAVRFSHHGGPPPPRGGSSGTAPAAAAGSAGPRRCR